ncbi:hypothetical protein D5086_023343 [Populus alba]|uniref:Uncharacterized protein n=1 Tax=Populus alba TaxID=43335 RepID=A0ACC4BB18_POPAL
MSREQPSPSPISQNDAQTPLNDDAQAQSQTPPVNRSNRPSRACTIRAAARLQQQAVIERKQKPKKQEQKQQLDKSSVQQKEQCSGGSSKIVTQLVAPPEPAQLPRWSLRSMWELASVLHFLNVFRHLLNITVEFSAEEFETALITPNDTLGDIHMPLLKADLELLLVGSLVLLVTRDITGFGNPPCYENGPYTRYLGYCFVQKIKRLVALGCRWGTSLGCFTWVEVEVYKTLDPSVRVVILKALCDIRVEQEDIRNYIDQLPQAWHSTFINFVQGTYWRYEDDPTIVKVVDSETSQCLTILYTNLLVTVEKLFTSKNRTEASLGKKLKNDMLPEIEKVYKDSFFYTCVCSEEERLLKKQHRQALLLDNFLNIDDLHQDVHSVIESLLHILLILPIMPSPLCLPFQEFCFWELEGYDYDRSINEAIKITKRKPPSPEPVHRREGFSKPEASTNGKWSGPSHASQHGTFSAASPNSLDYDDMDEDHKSEALDRSNRRRQRPQRYSAKEFVEAVSDNEADFDSDDDIVGEAVYDDEYLRKRKQKRLSSSSEGDEEYQWDDENGEEEEEEDEEEGSLSISEDSDEPQKIKKLPGRTRRETKLRSVDEIQSGLRRSRRATRNQINYRQYELSESETESMKHEKSNASDEHSDASENAEYSARSQSGDSDGNDDEQSMKVDQPVEGDTVTAREEQNQPPEESNSPVQEEVEGVRKRRFLDLNELAPGSGFDDSPNTVMKDEDRNDF